MTRAERKPKTAEQKERDRILARERRVKNKEAIAAQKSAKWAAGKLERDAKKATKEKDLKEEFRQRELWKRYERSWLKEAKPRFFDWGYEWTKEQSRKTSLSKYHSLSPEEKKEHNRRVMSRNPEARKARLAEWRRRNPEKVKSLRRKWIKANPERARELRRRAEKSTRLNPRIRAKLNLRTRFKQLMREIRQGKAGFSKLLGCSNAEFVSHLESKFARGMTWENYGTHWHVDHVLPCAAFDHTRPDHVRRCWHYLNLQPLWAADNLRKSDIIPEGQLILTI